MLEGGITIISLIPVRGEPRHSAELVTQLLFGEMYTVLEKQGDWLRISCSFDHYTGFISLNQHTPLSEKIQKELENSDKSIVLDLVHSIGGSDHKFPVSIGSFLYDFDGVNCRVGKERFHFSGKTTPFNQTMLHGEAIKRVAIKFLHSPYLWGGRSPFGIDCSGFSQLVYKVCGKPLPRDAWQQAEVGKTLHFLHETREGDLAFFSNDEGRIIHVGILLDQNQIIHASGKVRIDTIDHYGIYNKELKKYTHQLRLIKRLI
jgi:hypothetical protein